MPISGLLLTLSADPTLAAGVAPALAGRDDVTVGTARERWLPLALEAPDDGGCRLAHDWLRALPGVEFVDVVSVHFDDAALPAETSSPLPHES